jgi:hypothetical protein
METATALSASQSALSDLQVDPVCIGDGVDAQSLGLISTVVVPTVIGLLLWVSHYFTTPTHAFIYLARRSYYLVSYAHAIVKYMLPENGSFNKSALRCIP